MDIIKDWHKIRQHFNKSMQTSFHASIASVDADNRPTVTPIGSFILNKNQTGFYFEMYASKLRLNASTNPNICVLGVNSSSWFWLKSLFSGQFNSYPAIKLYGVLGKRRKATELEINRFKKRVKLLSGTKGYKLLWSDKMEYVRDITFNKAEKVNIGKMTGHL